MCIAMRKEYIFYVYFMISSSRRALYLGMTSGLRNRVWQHENKVFEGFSSKYNCSRLVYYEIYDDVRRAIAREKQLKRWSRAKKDALIERFNPTWRDLAEDWFKAETQGPSTSVRAIPTEGIANPAADGRSE
jgi:putative endonuclease